MPVFFSKSGWMCAKSPELSVLVVEANVRVSSAARAAPPKQAAAKTATAGTETGIDLVALDFRGHSLEVAGLGGLDIRQGVIDRDPARSQ